MKLLTCFGMIFGGLWVGIMVLFVTLITWPIVIGKTFIYLYKSLNKSAALKILLIIPYLIICLISIIFWTFLIILMSPFLSCFMTHPLLKEGCFGCFKILTLRLDPYPSFDRKPGRLSDFADIMIPNCLKQ